MRHGEVDLNGALNNDQVVAGDMIIENKDQDKDILIKVNDGGVSTTVQQIHGAIGAVNLPLQPAFLVALSEEQSNITNDNVYQTIVFGTEIFDIGNNFASNTFTAPIAGKYILTMNVNLDLIDIDATYYQVQLVTSNRTYELTYHPAVFNIDCSWVFAFSVVADMDASDTAYVQIRQSGGAQQTDIHVATRFSGVLVC